MTLTRTRKSLHIGTNYPGTDAALAGCVNDARAWEMVCSPRGYDPRLLLDGEATRDAIIGSIGELVESLGYGDRGVITYSGHGTWVPDLDGDELDRRDEAICPTDFRAAGVITDDTLYELMRAAKYGARLVFIADSCFSGTLQRFAPPITRLPGLGDGPPRRVRFLPPVAFLTGAQVGRAMLVEQIPARGRFRRSGSGLVLSACEDDQVTFDTVVDGRPCGIFTHVAISALDRIATAAVEEDRRAPTYREWHRAIRSALPSVDYPAVTPQLDGTSDQKRWEVFA